MFVPVLARCEFPLRAPYRFMFGHIPVYHTCPHGDKWVKCGVCNPCDDGLESDSNPSLLTIFGWD